MGFMREIEEDPWLLGGAEGRESEGGFSCVVQEGLERIIGLWAVEG